MFQYAAQWDYQELGHKVFFDYFSKLIYVSPFVTTLDVKVDLYSDMKEAWNLLDRKNRNFKPPIRVIGGDNTTGGQKAGDIYFMREGWRVVYDPTKVAVSGVLFSDDYDTPWLYSENLQPVYPAQVSSLVTGVDIEAVTAPSATTVASAVRSELTTELGRIDVATSTRASQTSVDNVQTTANTIDGKADAIQTVVDSIETKVDSVIVTLGNISTVIDTMHKFNTNKTIIDPNNHTMTIYDDDGITPIHVFDLQDANGVASITDIYRRIPQ